jgi:DNA-binding PadR family transcriptional regulator
MIDYYRQGICRIGSGMRPPRTELNLTEWIVLALASEAPTHGWTVVRALRRDSPLGEVWSSSGPLVYRAVSRLQDADLLHSVGTAEGHGPNRVILEATPAGLEQVREWLLEPVDHVRDVRTVLLVKLLLLERRGTDRTLLVQRQRERLLPVATALAERAAAATGPDRVVAEWRALSADAVMRFLDAVDPVRVQ